MSEKANLSSAMLYLLIFMSWSAVVLLTLSLCHIIDARMVWVSLVLFVLSIGLYPKLTRPRRRKSMWSSEDNIPSNSPYSNAPLSEPTVVMSRKEASKNATPTVDPIVAQQTSSRFMTPEEVYGGQPFPMPRSGEPTVAINAKGTASVFGELPISPEVGNAPLTRDDLTPIFAAHLRWLERGALPEANGRAVLQRSDLTGIDLSGVILSRANLTGCNFQTANMSDVNLNGATLCQSNLSKADFRGADLREADLRDSQLCGADGRGADLRGAELIQAQIAGANLSGADLSEAYLSSADLSGADLSGAKLDGAYLSGALLMGADLSGTSLEGIDLRRARYDEKTRWPARFEPRLCGAIAMNESTTRGGVIASPTS